MNRKMKSSISIISLTLLSACSGMPTSEDLRDFSKKLKSVVESPDKQGKSVPDDPRKAPVINESLKEICDTVLSNPVTGIENYFKKRITVRGVVGGMSQNYIDDYSVTIRTREGIPIFLEVNDRNVIRSLQMKMNVEVIGSIASVGDMSSTSKYKNCSVSLKHVDIIPLQ